MNTMPQQVNPVEEQFSTRVIRRLAKKHGLTIVRGRGKISIDNLGEYMLLDERKTIVGGPRYDMTEQEILSYINALRYTV